MLLGADGPLAADRRIGSPGPLSRPRIEANLLRGPTRYVRAERCYDSLGLRADRVRDIGEYSGSFVTVLDDVLTSGAHVEASRNHLAELFPNNDIICVCWAKAERLDDEV